MLTSQFLNYCWIYSLVVLLWLLSTCTNLFRSSDFRWGLQLRFALFCGPPTLLTVLKIHNTSDSTKTALNPNAGSPIWVNGVQHFRPKRWTSDATKLSDSCSARWSARFRKQRKKRPSDSCCDSCFAWPRFLTCRLKSCGLSVTCKISSNATPEPQFNCRHDVYANAQGRLPMATVQFMVSEDVNQDKHIGMKEFDLLLKNLEFRETLLQFGHGPRLENTSCSLWRMHLRHRHSDVRRYCPGNLTWFGRPIGNAWDHRLGELFLRASQKLSSTTLYHPLQLFLFLPFWRIRISISNTDLPRARNRKNEVRLAFCHFKQLSDAMSECFGERLVLSCSPNYHHIHTHTLSLRSGRVQRAY